ncbi:Putative NAD(P)H nitroreductase mhqN [Kingella potus]|uniref:NAD(P)H nitroreductase mhqN n=1 Tax=Kingella potus TaxID=265175 RepID=A0A377R1L2_9NEIS|nr:nitroreductase family protein [Kingella potus]UOP00177.1 nitroreductase family protein [Kingella potus]STR02760.1 Putative NAD(P)H nitroreductase mhqN [Kingella potus]
MSLQQMLTHRRSVRRYADTPIDPDVVRECLRLAQLAPSSSNMQLYAFYHVTDKTVLSQLAEACFGQTAAATAQQMVVFVTRQDTYRSHAQAALDFERGNVRRNSPPDRQAKRIANYEGYYGKLMPFLYARCFGLLGGLRWLISRGVGLFRTMQREVTETDVRVVVHKSCALAAQTFMLAMAERGLDTCPLEGLDSRRVKQILQLPRGAEINMIVACGVRDGDRGVWGERFRLPFDEVYRKV